jgi:hypothetical protein
MANNPSSMSKRALLKISAAACATGWLSACSRAAEHPARAEKFGPPTLQQLRYEASRQRMQKKFGGLGAELVVDAMFGQQFLGVTFSPEFSTNPFFKGGKGGPGYSGLAVSSLSEIPERVRIIWRDANGEKWDKEGIFLEPIGRIIGEEIVEVGSRIPQEAVEQIKRLRRAGLGVKFRMSNQGTMVGWHVARRRIAGNDADTDNIDLDVQPQVGLVYSMAGGDFREAEIFNGIAIRKGWYIDKKTGQKIETDF